MVQTLVRLNVFYLYFIYLLMQPQYTFIHSALLEHIACGDTSIAAPFNNVQDKIDELSAVNPKAGKTGFQLQFEVQLCSIFTLSIVVHQKLVRTSSKEGDFMYVAAVSSKNKIKNRSQKLLPRKCVHYY